MHIYFLSSFCFLFIQGTKAVLGICWNISEIDELFTLDEDAFKGMSNLRFLKIYKNPLERNEETKLYLPQGIQSLSRRLRLLHWDAYPMSRMPSHFSPAYLVELGMIDSELEEMWEGPQVSFFCRVIYIPKFLMMKT